MIKLETITKLVEESKNFPKPTIEYNGELPEHKEITPDSFFGVNARYNPLVRDGAKLIYNMF